MMRALLTAALSLLLVTGNAQPAAAAESTLKAYVTGYSWYDNTPPGSAEICGDGRRPQNGPCHKGYPRSASTWLDVWVGGRNVSARTAERCMDRITQVTTVIVRPAKGLPVIRGDIARKGC